MDKIKLVRNENGFFVAGATEERRDYYRVSAYLHDECGVLTFYVLRSRATKPADFFKKILIHINEYLVNHNPTEKVADIRVEAKCVCEDDIPKNLVVVNLDDIKIETSEKTEKSTEAQTDLPSIKEKIFNEAFKCEMSKEYSEDFITGLICSLAVLTGQDTVSLTMDYIRYVNNRVPKSYFSLKGVNYDGEKLSNEDKVEITFYDYYGPIYSCVGTVDNNKIVVMGDVPDKYFAITSTKVNPMSADELCKLEKELSKNCTNFVKPARSASPLLNNDDIQQLHFTRV